MYFTKRKNVLNTNIMELALGNGYKKNYVFFLSIKTSKEISFRKGTHFPVSY